MTQEKNTNIPNSTFDKMNTKIDPSQNGSPIPFQVGDFASSNYEGKSSKSILEILIFYILGIALSIAGYFVLINAEVFRNVLNDTIWSFAVLFGIVSLSFIISKIVQILVTRVTINQRKLK